ncbi:hypothetical protein [Amycolatopsis sp. NPDC098790]|uniref:NucA/NucB deoxyribonuclease domain-containing protein n=1 Tax=Amycolatopsis sp. NPDC098790 TaxID=3363939 RepID=UPI00380A382E
MASALTTGTAAAETTTDGQAGLVSDRQSPTGQPVQVPVSAVNQTNPPPRTLAERVRWESAPKQETYSADIGKYATSGPAPLIAVDPVTLDECDNHEFPSGDPVWWHKNHYSTCWSGFDNLYKPASCPIFCSDSLNSFRLVVIGVGDSNVVPPGTTSPPVRKARFTIRTSEGQKYGPEPAPDSSLIQLRLNCVALDDSTCQNSQSGGVTRTLGELRSGFETSFDLTISGPGAFPDDPDQKTYYNTSLTITNTLPPDYLPPEVSLPDDALRCDTSTYTFNVDTQRRDNGACIFTNVDAVLHYSKAAGSPVKAVAEHIELAQTHPENTKPGGVGKNIPGSRASGAHLFRLVPELGVGRDDRYEANRLIAVANCIRFWGLGYTKGGTLDCDEYPFASTYEGAAYNLWNGGGTAVSYSSMPLDRSQNRAAGRALGIWYSVDHILEKDGYYVQIDS